MSKPRVLQLNHVAIGIGNVRPRGSTAVLPTRDKVSASPLHLLDRPTVIAGVGLEPKVLESACHPDRLVRLDR